MMNFIKYLLSFVYRDSNFTGVLPDDRLPSEKQRDYLHEERPAMAVADPFGNAQIDTTPYIDYNQLFTYSCVAHGVGLALAAERLSDTGIWQAISPIFDYRLRPNYPQEGASLPAIADIYKKVGTPLYTTVPTPGTEKEANAIVITEQMRTEAAIFKGKEYFSYMFPNDIDELATVAQMGHGVAILIYATEDEYSRSFPIILNPNLSATTAEIRHCVCILPNSGFKKDGIKYVTVQDSSWFGGWKIRHLSEEFIQKRCYGALYWDTVAVIGTGPKPKWTFSMPLRYSQSNNEVKMVQQLLISEGLMPGGYDTGFFGGRTLAAVNAFQSRYAADILIPQGLTKPTGFWGDGCIKKANQLCA
jgi:peptidoglycan hydrolase-like protein with peptidoglycan-binding domain